MAIVDERLSYDLPQYMKDGMLLVLSRFPEHYTDIAHIRECLKLPGKTIINTCEALILAGVIRPYYAPYADRLENHPAILNWVGVPQHMVDTVRQINDLDHEVAAAPENSVS